MVAISLVFLGAGVLFVGLGVPLVRRRVKPNALYGLRTAATLADEAVWYEANAAAGRDLVVLGAVVALAAGGGFLLPGRFEEPWALGMAGLVGGGALVMCVRGVRLGRRLAAERDGGP